MLTPVEQDRPHCPHFVGVPFALGQGAGATVVKPSVCCRCGASVAVCEVNALPADHEAHGPHVVFQVRPKILPAVLSRPGNG